MSLPVYPFYKGCVKPPMVFGMPLVGAVLAFMSWFLLVMYSVLFASVLFALAWTVIFVGACAYLRHISKSDGYVLAQKFLRLRLRSRNRNRRYWGAVSYSPLKRLR